MTRYTPPKVKPPKTKSKGDDIAAKLTGPDCTMADRQTAAAYIIQLEAAMKVMITDRLNWQRGHKTDIR